MNTISIRTEIYNNAVVYARNHNVSVDTLVERFIISLLKESTSDATLDNVASKKVRYKISPKVKALEMGFVCPDTLSVDYKEEIKEGKIRKGL